MILDTLKQHWPIVVVGVVCLLVGAGLSWKLKPDVVEVQEKTVEKIVEKQVVDTKMVEEEVQKRLVDIEAARQKHEVKVVVTEPDGKKTETTTTDTSSTKTQHEVEIQYVDRVVTVEKVVEKVVDRVVEKTITPVQPNWRVGALVGVQPSFSPLGIQPMSFGITADRRLAGPFFIGLWALTDVNVAKPSFEDIKVGVRLSIDF